MSEGNTNPEFLRRRFPTLTKSPEVMTAAKRTRGRTGVEVPREPEPLIQNYLNRFKEIIKRDEPQERTRGITALKKVLVNRYVVRVEDIPDSYWQSQMRVVRNRGRLGDWQDLSKEELFKIKKEHLAQTKEDQKGSLEEWIDYLASDKSSYLPDYLKYWVFQGMLRLERYEKGEEGKPGRFPERPTGRQRSVKMFPEVNERALKFIASAYDAKFKNQSINFRYDIPQSAQEVFLEALGKKDFRSLYGWGQEYIPSISEEEMQTTEGQWITYAQVSEAKTLSRTLQGKGSGWCIAGENVAHDYLKNGDLSIYYTRDREGDLTIPRVVIVSQGSRVTEVRGIEWEENVDYYIKGTNIIGDKLKEIPGGEQFFETDADTKQLTAIDRKITSGMQLDTDELTFLYEIDRPIKYFGFKKDPRIAELKSQRNPEEDMPIVFGCTLDQIAHRVSEIREDTKAYVGPLERGIFNRLQGIDHVYTSFPEGKIRRDTFEIGGKSESQLEQELQQVNIHISEYAKGILYSKDFTTLPNPRMLDTVRLKVADLLPGNPTTDQIYAKAKELGLELVPAEGVVHYRLKYKDQPLNEWLYMGMKQIADRDGHPYVFLLGRSVDGLWLHYDWSLPDDWWHPRHEFLFALSKSEPQKPGLLDRLFKR